MATLEELEKRLKAVEDEVAFLRARLFGPPADETPAQRGARMLREAKLAHPALVAGWTKAMEQMGIQGQPIAAEKLQEMMRACGVKPENNEFSRGIIEMREE
jgi:hypothetical protein